MTISPDVYIGLTSTAEMSGPIDVRDATHVSIQVRASTWGSAELELKWSNAEDESAQYDIESFNPPIIFSSTNPSRNNIYVGTVKTLYIAGRTAAGSSSAEAYVYIHKTRLGAMTVVPYPKILAQLRSTSTSFQSLYSPAAGVTTRLDSIIVCNTTSTTKTYRICIDDDGSTYTQATAVAWDESIRGFQKWPDTPIPGGIVMTDPDGNVAVRSSTSGACTFTLIGAEW